MRLPPLAMYSCMESLLEPVSNFVTAIFPQHSLTRNALPHRGLGAFSLLHGWIILSRLYDALDVRPSSQSVATGLFLIIKRSHPLVRTHVV